MDGLNFAMGTVSVCTNHFDYNIGFTAWLTLFFLLYFSSLQERNPHLKNILIRLSLSRDGQQNGAKTAGRNLSEEIGGIDYVKPGGQKGT